jgi:hypothetical protein
MRNPMRSLDSTHQMRPAPGTTTSEGKANMARQEMWVHGHSAHIKLNDRGRGPGEDVGPREWTAIDCEFTRERLRRLLAGLLPHAERLGCASALLDASRPLAADGAAGVHRGLAARHGWPDSSWRCQGVSPPAAHDAIGQRADVRRPVDKLKHRVAPWLGSADPLAGGRRL